MIRGVLFELFLFLLPFLVYGVYWRLATGTGGARDKISYPAVALSAAGLALAVGGLLWWTISGANPSGSVYVPPHLENGEIVPGQFEPSEDQ